VTLLQLALDGSLEPSLRLLNQVCAFVDVVELGTPLIFREGMKAARAIRREFPHVPILADLKIMDAGEIEATIAFEAGCRWVTVLGATSDTTVCGVLSAAKRFEGYTMADLMHVADPLLRAKELLEIGCHMLCVHTAYDLQTAGHAPLATLSALRTALPNAPLAVAGGVDLDVIQEVMTFAPQIVIVGGAITRADDPAAAVRRLRKWVRGQ
jgi:3-hexulose-6-phosphate synthase